MNTLAIGGPCRLCGRPNIEHGHGHCPPAVQWVADGVARVKARLVADPEMAKALLPNMTHAEVKPGAAEAPGLNPSPEVTPMTKVLDVRGLHGRPARIREIRAMAGRAMLDGPHDYKTEDLEGPLLDLAVSKAAKLPAVIHKVDNAIAPFYECRAEGVCRRGS